MKDLFKQELLESINKVQSQEYLTRYRYIDRTGCRCIIGHLLSDKETTKILAINNSLRVSALYKWHGLFQHLTEEQLKVLQNLQHMHDRAEDKESFLKKARKYVNSL